MSLTILDGGLGQEIVHRAGKRPTPLWSTSVMMEDPSIVRAVHADYFRAGAQIATTNTYCVMRDRLAPAGIEARFEGLMTLALDAAEAARDAHGDGRIAGSLGPIGASYRADLMPPHDRAVEIYAEIADLLAPRVDILLAETVVSVAHARAVAAAATGRGRPFWLAVSCMDDDGRHLRSGEPIGALAPVIAEFSPDAVLVNCARPEAVSDALPLVARLGRPFGAYANGFTRITEGFLADRPTVEALEARPDLGPATYADFADGWIMAGAAIVGGCCETTPAHIAEITRRHPAGTRAA